MHYHTLEFDTEVTNEDLQYYENVPGVIGMSGYRNIINLYYEMPPTKQEVASLAQAVYDHQLSGVTLIATDPEPLTVISL